MKGSSMNDSASKEGTSVVGIAFAFASAALFGILVPCSKMLIDSLAPLQLAALLLIGAGVGACCLLVVRSALRRPPAATAIGKDDAAKLALMAALNAIAVGLLACGIAKILAANASLIMGFEIAAATVCGWLFFNRHVCCKAIAAVGLICIAAFLLSWNTAGGIAFVPESLFIVAACILRGFEGGLKRSLAAKDPLQVICVRNLGAGLALLVAAFALGGIPSAPVGVLGNALVLGFVTFGIAAILHLSAQRMIGSARAEGYFALAPFVGMLVSWGYFGFELDPLFFGALALMALGVWLAMDDSVFHEDSFAALNQERLSLYTGEAAAFGFDLMHRPLNR